MQLYNFFEKYMCFFYIIIDSSYYSVHESIDTVTKKWIVYEIFLHFMCELCQFISLRIFNRAKGVLLYVLKSSQDQLQE